MNNNVNSSLTKTETLKGNVTVAKEGVTKKLNVHVCTIL